jgi:decaprenylphospho-beta-D-erythro-pentofuranosid-2-ulose 2-reductase
MQRVLIVGATSAIAEATARLFAQRGDTLFLAARNLQRMLATAEDLRLRGAAAVHTHVFDAQDLAACEPLIEAAEAQMGTIDVSLIAHGTLSVQSACQTSTQLLQQEFVVNALSFMALATLLANKMEARGSGVIALISSVAGDRGRQSNYAYGSAKAAVSAFASGMRQRLFAKGVRVVTIKPGFVDTPMTAAFKKGALWASPATVAAAIVRAIDQGTPVLYVPWFWRPIMLIIRLVPEFVFRRLRL